MTNIFITSEELKQYNGNRCAAIRETLYNLGEDKIYELWNDFAEKNRYESIYPLSSLMLADICSTIEDAFELGALGRFNLGDDYCYYHDVYGWTSFSRWENSPVDIDELAEYLAEDGSYFEDEDE